MVLFINFKSLFIKIAQGMHAKSDWDIYFFLLFLLLGCFKLLVKKLALMSVILVEEASKYRGL